MRWRPDRAVLTAVAVIALDQWSKWLAFRSIDVGTSVNVLPGVSFGRTENTGVAFGTFADRPGLVMVLMAAALCVLAWFYLRHRNRPGLWFATGLLLGGAVGNAIDRIALGHVRDFIEFPSFPSFNVADVAITFGVVLLVVTFDRGRATEEPADGEQ